MAASLFSPCMQCDHMLPGIVCSPRRRTRCARYLNYIKQLHQSRTHHILINELKELIIKEV